MNVVQNLLPTSKYKLKSPYTMVADSIVVHNTANDATAKNEIAYMIRNDNSTSFHYAIDDKEIVQGIPDNRKGLSIEICYSKSGGQRFIDAEKLSAKFIAFKLNEKGWGVDRVKKHQDFSGKYCPHRTLDMGWQRFLNMVQTELDKLKGVVKVNKTVNNTPSSWAKESWEFAKQQGWLDGSRPKDTITREEVAVILHRLYKSGKLK